MAKDYDIENRSDSTWLFFKGNFDEDAELPDWKLIPAKKKVAIDLVGLKALNSSGIRTWMIWVQQQPKDLLVVDLYNVPAFFLDQATMVKGFLPADYRIHSFRLRYFCEATDETKEKLFREDAELKFTVFENVAVPVGNEELEFEADHMLSKTLRSIESRVRIEPFFKGPFFDDQGA